MIELELLKSPSRPLHLLCLGAHSDDIEIGCGGTILKLLDQHAMHVDWIVLSAGPERRPEAEGSAALFLKRAKSRHVAVYDFRASFFPYVGDRIKDVFEELKTSCTPDVILTHAREDLHQDHRVVCELTWNTFRNHLILEYEIPKFDGDLGSPNLFVRLSPEQLQRKVDYLMRCYGSQTGKHWFTADTFQGLARLRGVQSVCLYAEAFYCRKMVM